MFRDMLNRKNKTVNGLVFAGITLLVLTGLAADVRANLVDSNSIIKDDIKYYFQTDNSVYDLGENVEMLYRVTNLRLEPVTFHFSNQVQHYFSVKDNEELIWDAPKVHFPSTSSFVLQPNGYKEYSETWNMFDNEGVLITVGSYEIIGSLHPIFLSQDDKDKYVPVSVGIQVIPEPTTIFLMGTGVIGILSFRKIKR